MEAGGNRMKTCRARDKEFEGELDELEVSYPRHKKQEMIDCLIATRAAYESSRQGVEEVLNRQYDLPTPQYELLYQRVRSVGDSSGSNKILSPHEQSFVVVRSRAGYVMVACRGTFNISDFIADLKVARLPLSFARGRAQIGFSQRAMAMPLDLFFDLLRAGEKIIFTGHSMGGAVASLTVLRILETLAAVPGHLPIAQENLSCITFGTAPFASKELAAYVNSHHRSTYYNIVSKHDLIPRLHAVIPCFIFPVARGIAQHLRRRWEVKIVERIVGKFTRMPVEKLVMKVEETVPFLWPATRLFNYLRRAAAYDEESLFFAHVGHVLLLDPDTKGLNSTLVMDETETASFGLNFSMGNKGALGSIFEHGLANYYACLVKALVLHSEKSKMSRKQTVEIPDEILQPIKPIFGGPAGHWPWFDRLDRLILKLTGNDFPVAK